MKKAILILAVVFFAVSCKSTQPIANTKKNRSSEIALKGNWTITNVSYPGSEYIKVNSFDIADSKCFYGSTWSFVSNNNKGTMSITAPDCPSMESPITWYINDNNRFVMKILNAGVKAKKAREGYILDVRNQSENSFELVDHINVGSTPTDVVYTFTKY